MPEQAPFNFWNSSHFHWFGKNYRFQVTTINILSVYLHHLFRSTYCSSYTWGARTESSKSVSYCGGGKERTDMEGANRTFREKPDEFLQVTWCICTEIGRFKLLCYKTILFHCMFHATFVYVFWCIISIGIKTEGFQINKASSRWTIITPAFRLTFYFFPWSVLFLGLTLCTCCTSQQSSQV